MPSRVLVIDDESAIRESLEVLLTLEGYTVFMAPDGEEGLRKIETESYDLVLLDLALPGQSGLELLPQIKERSRVASHYDTAYMARWDNVVEAIRAGADNFVQKPLGQRESCLPTFVRLLHAIALRKRTFSSSERSSSVTISPTSWARARACSRSSTWWHR